MSNVLKVSHQETVRSLHEKGWSQRRIARELGINRQDRVANRYGVKMHHFDPRLWDGNGTKVHHFDPRQDCRTSQSQCDPFAASDHCEAGGRG